MVESEWSIIIFSKYFKIQFAWPTFLKRPWTVMSIMSTNRKNTISSTIFIWNIISKLIRYSETYWSHQDFHYRGLLLSKKLLNKWFLVVMWMLSTLYGRHNDVVNRYGISVSHMSTDMSCPPFLYWWRNRLTFPSTRADPGLLMQQY
jgi:hypothetical protein